MKYINRSFVRSTYPDNIDSDQDVYWVVVWNVLEHAHVGIKAHFSGHLI